MSNPTVGQVCKGAQALLNDVAASKYTNQVLLPYIQMALDELEEELLLISSEIFKEVSAKLDVPANTTEIAYTGTTPVLPSDFTEPILVEEKVDGALDSTYVPMTKVGTLTVLIPGIRLVEYTWEEQSLKFLGSINAVDIRIKYLKGFPILTDPVDTAQIILYNKSKLFLQYKTAALAAELIAQNHDRALALHDSALAARDRLLGMRARSAQDLPVRRRAWQRQTRRTYR